VIRVAAVAALFAGDREAPGDSRPRVWHWLVGVALPAVVLYCYRSATAEVIGANLWIVGPLFLARRSPSG
jgi:hypothetical protein